MIAVNFIAGYGTRYIRQLLFEEAPVVGDTIDLIDEHENIKGIYIVNSRMWKNGGKAVDLYVTRCENDRFS